MSLEQLLSLSVSLSPKGGSAAGEGAPGTSFKVELGKAEPAKELDLGEHSTPVLSNNMPTTPSQLSAFTGCWLVKGEDGGVAQASSWSQ